MIALKDIRYSLKLGKYTPGVSLVYAVHTTGTELPTLTDPAAAETVCAMVLGPVGSKSFFNSYIESKEAAIQTGGVWQVTVNLTDAGAFGPNWSGSAATPMDEPAKYSYAFEPLQTVVDKCFGSKLNTAPTFSATPDTHVINSAGDPFDPPLETDTFLMTISVTKNELTKPTNFSTCVGCINADSMTIDGVNYVAHSLLFRYNAEDAYYTKTDGQRVRYFVNSYQYTFKKDLWIRQIVDAGYTYYNTAGGTKTKSEIVVRLNSDGTKAPAQDFGGTVNYWYVADKKATTLPGAPT
jgi:hypothetical protein